MKIKIMNRKILSLIFICIFTFSNFILASASEPGEHVVKEAAYQVIYWQEKAETPASDGNQLKYDYIETETKRGNVGDLAEYTDKAYTGFSLDKDKSGTDVVITADGKAVKNVYYNRNMYSIRFFDGTTGMELESLHIGAKYGQDISDIWVDDLHSAHMWAFGGSANDYHVLLATMPAQNLELYENDKNKEKDYVYYTQNPDGTWNLKWAVKGFGNMQGKNPPQIPGYVFSGLKTGTFQGLSREDETKSYQGTYFTYIRESYQLTLTNFLSQNDSRYQNIKVPYDALIQSRLPEESVLVPPEGIDENARFLGWYTSPTFDPSTKVTDEERMPARNLTLFAGWEIPDVPPPDPEVPDPEPEVPDPEPEVPDPEPEVPDPEPEVPDPEPEIPDPEVPEPKPEIPEPELPELEAELPEPELSKLVSEEPEQTPEDIFGDYTLMLLGEESIDGEEPDDYNLSEVPEADSVPAAEDMAENEQCCTRHVWLFLLLLMLELCYIYESKVRQQRIFELRRQIDELNNPEWRR